MIDVVLCASGRDEVRIVHDLAQMSPATVRIVRRCADLAETLAVVAAGGADAVVIDLDVRGLGRDRISDLLSGAAVVGLRSSEDTTTTSLGLTHVLTPDAPIGDLVETVSIAVQERSGVREAVSQQATSEPSLADGGRLVGVWGPTGAPGRTTIALNLAAEIAAAGRETLLIDADTCGPALAQMLGVLDESPGLAAACRARDRDTLDAEVLRGLTDLIRPHLRLLPGIGAPSRWPHVQEESLRGVLEIARQVADVSIIDIAALLEEDEDLSYDTLAPQRNAAAITTIGACDLLIVVVAADPVSITRLLRQRSRLQEIGAQELHVIVNRVGPPADAARIRELIATRLPVRTLHLLPDDSATCRRALWEGAMLIETAARTPLRRGLARIAETVIPVQDTVPEAGVPVEHTEQSGLDRSVGRPEMAGGRSVQIAAPPGRRRRAAG